MSQNEMRKENEQDRISIPRLLSAKDVAQILGISARTVNRLVREGKLACVQVTTKERRFTEGQVRAYIEAKSKEVRVDTRTPDRVKSEPKKGGNQKESHSEKAKDSWASLKKEMSLWT